jgi:DNA invertase Pin-like site-specific DNA recombinase
VDVYADEGLTGTEMSKRTQFQRMLNDCRRGKIDKILCKSVSRFSRNFTDCLEVIHELKCLGVTVVFDKEGIDTSKMSGETRLAMQASAAQRESMSISGNLRRGVRMKMKTGEFLPSSVPFGYKLNTKLRTFELVPQEAEVVKRIFSEYLSGKGMQQISDILNQNKVSRENDVHPGKPVEVKWKDNTVKYILLNPAYTGDTYWQKSFTTETVPFTKIKNNGQVQRWHVQDHNPPIISHEDFERVQKLMEQRREKFCTVSQKTGNPLQRAVYCECGSICRRRVINDKVYWTCKAHERDKESCAVTQAPEPELLAAFERMWNKLKLHRSEILEPMLEQLRLAADRKFRSDPKISDITNEILSLVEQLHVLERLRCKGYIEPALYSSQRLDIDRKVAALRRTKERLMSEDDGGAVAAVENLMDALETGEPDSDGFAETVERIIIRSDNKIVIRLRCGLELTETIRRAVR